MALQLVHLTALWSRSAYTLSIRQLNLRGFPGGSASKESACNPGDRISIPGFGWSSRGGNCHPLQYACLGNPMNRGVWWDIVHGIIRVGVSASASVLPVNISQARILEWVAISFSRGSSWPRDQTCISWIGRRVLYHWATREARSICS